MTARVLGFLSPQQCQCDLMIASCQLLADLRPVRQGKLV